MISTEIMSALCSPPYCYAGSALCAPAVYVIYAGALRNSLKIGMIFKLNDYIRAIRHTSLGKSTPRGTRNVDFSSFKLITQTFTAPPVTPST